MGMCDLIVAEHDGIDAHANFSFSREVFARMVECKRRNQDEHSDVIGPNIEMDPLVDIDGQVGVATVGSGNGVVQPQLGTLSDEGMIHSEIAKDRHNKFAIV